MSTSAETQPQFSFTRHVIDNFQEKGFSPEDFSLFTNALNGYLARKANTEGLIALGLLAVPSNQGAANYLVDDGGFVMDAIGYWSKLPLGAEKRRKKNHAEFEEWFDLGYTSKVSPANFESRSLEDYPSLKAFETALQDSRVRAGMTLTAGDCEFWGFVTTEQLRKEMQLTQHSNPIQS